MTDIISKIVQKSCTNLFNFYIVNNKESWDYILRTICLQDNDSLYCVIWKTTKLPNLLYNLCKLSFVISKCPFLRMRGAALFLSFLWFALPVQKSAIINPSYSNICSNNHIKAVKSISVCSLCQKPLLMFHYV